MRPFTRTFNVFAIPVSVSSTFCQTDGYGADGVARTGFDRAAGPVPPIQGDRGGSYVRLYDTTTFSMEACKICSARRPLACCGGGPGAPLRLRRADRRHRDSVARVVAGGLPRP